jgi:hypothetical protein
MNEERESDNGSVLFELAGRGSVVVIVLLVLYVLSFGPTVMMWRKSKVTSSVVRMYEPPGYAALAVPKLKAFLEWYACDVCKCPVRIELPESEKGAPMVAPIHGTRAPK